MLLCTRHTNLLTQTLLYILPLTQLWAVIPSHWVCAENEHISLHVNANLSVCSFCSSCRVRAEKESCRKRRRRRPERKRNCAITAIIWCHASSPAVPPAHCAARPCRKSTACSARVSNATATSAHVPTLILKLTHTRAQVFCSHTNLHLFIPVWLHACALNHLLEHSST